MFHKTKVTVVPPGYQPDLDRLPPSQAGCGTGCLFAVVLLFLLVGVGGGALYFLTKPETPTTIDAVVMMETLSVSPPARATATPTMDYCWFLTPTIEALPTIHVTMDTWQIKATDDRYLTGTPRPTDLPTQEPPKAWCNEPPVMEATVTLTPYGIPTGIPHLDSDATATITDTPQPVMPTAVPSSTLFPTLVPRAENVQPVNTGSGNVQTVIVIQTVVVVEKVKDKVIKVVTATPTATEDIPEVTEEPTVPTETATDSPTVAPTLTPTATATYTLTSTLTLTPTATGTNTPTATQTATTIPTSTLFPTFIPTETHTPTETATETVTNA